MSRDIYNRKIQQIKDEILLLGSMVEQAALDAVSAFKLKDLEAAKTIIEDDQAINDKRFAIENAIMILFATQQPLAHDMRLLSAMLLLSNELERMGDYAKGIANNTIRLGLADIPIPIRNIEKMADLGVSMLHRALSAFVNENMELAIKIPEEDDLVDELFNKSYRAIVNAMISNPSIIDDASFLLWVVHNLERFADRTVNICERTIFIISGELLEMDREDNELIQELK
ncbi:MAG: phosphate signaling complex protein PhoU [Anaerolineaceae bacterium]|nr:phosphate signaling complex protein PhoU [Anaerolineaceae bacterium]